VLKKHNSVADLMKDHCRKEEEEEGGKCGQLSFNWRMFGSADQTKYHAVPVTRRFQYITTAWQGTIKVIADPKAVNLEDFHWQHSMRLKQGYRWLDTSGNVIKNKGWRVMTNDANPSDVAVLHHYRYKSQEEWDYGNCVRGKERMAKARAKCHTPAEVGSIFVDEAWQQLRKMLAQYQAYDDMGDLT
jgi:hypothetical protein